MQLANTKIVVHPIEPLVLRILLDEVRPLDRRAIIEATVLQCGGGIEITDCRLIVGLCLGFGNDSRLKKKERGDRRLYSYQPSAVSLQLKAEN